MVGEVYRLSIRDKSLPGSPKQQDQKCQSAQPADHACFCQDLCVIIMAVIYHEAVIYGLIERKHFLQRTQSSSCDWVIEENPPGYMQHFNPAGLADLQALVAGEPLKRPADAQPRHKHCGQNYNQGRRSQFFFFSSSQNDQDGKQSHFSQKAHDAAPRSRKKQRPDGKQSEQSDQRQLVTPFGSQNQDGKARRDQQFHQAREVISIDVRTERNPAVAQFAHPVQFSVKCEVLQNGKQRHPKSKNKQEPDKSMPVLACSIGLHTKKKQS